MIIVFAQVEEVPAARSESAVEPPGRTQSETESMEPSNDHDFAARKDLSEQESGHRRDFITINFMIIVIMVLMVALAFFLVINRVRRSKTP